MTVMIAAVAVNFSLDIPRASLKETVATEAGIARERARFDDRTTVSDNTLHVNKQSFERFRLFHFHFNRGCLTLGTSLGGKEERLLIVSTMNSCIKFIILMKT